MRMSGSIFKPVFRFFCASTRNSQGALSALFFTNASRLGSSRWARSTASTSASRSGRWQSESRPPSFSSRNAHLEEYKAACVNIGRRVTFDLPDGGQGAGEAVDVDEEGRLVVRTDSGEEHVFTGEVSVRGIYGSL